MNPVTAVLVAVISYLAGSIPFSYLFVRWAKVIDLRKFGDGNVGATNASKAAGKAVGTAAFLFDVIKGVFPVFFARVVFKLPDTLCVIAGICSIAGHNWPVFLGFKGGKGLSTTMGVLGALVPIEAALFLAPLFILYFILKRWVFSMMLIGPLLPVICWLMKRSPSLIWGTAAIIALIFVHAAENAKSAWRDARNS